MSDLVRAEYPPNIEALRAAFPLRNGVIFAYYPHIYAPDGGMTPALVAHEMVHLDRQARHAGGVVGWWLDYIGSAEFRLMEEIPAHYAEYRYLVTAEPSRDSRRRNLAIIAKRLSSPLYGNMVSLETAKRILELGPDGAAELAKAGVGDDGEANGHRGNQAGIPDGAT